MEEPEPARPVAPPELSLQEKLAKLPVSFANPIALRVSFLMSLAIMMVEVIPVLNRLFFVWWVAAGWCAVLLYRRLTGNLLNVRSGARLGSITGILTFVSMAVVLSLTMFFTGRQVLDQMVQQDPRMTQVVNDPALLAGVFAMVLVIVFVLVVGLCAAGGALGARFSTRRT